ncbi:MAG: GTPase [Planctomycetota bacterium]|jgi:GTP-binding protein
MGVPRVVIVGRPNVGKSSVFNWLAGRRIAIVDPTSGVTRDRVTHLSELNDRYFELVDTGGMGIDDPDNLTEQIEEQIALAVDSADVILFVVDTRAGLAPLDDEVAKRLRAAATAGLSSSARCDTMFTMSNAQPRRKRVRHYDDPGHFHELTFSCYHRMPLLTNDTWCEMLSSAIDRAFVRHQY